MLLRDTKQTGLFALLYFLCMGLGVLVNHFIDRSGAMFYAPALTAVFGGTVYFYFLEKIQRFGAVTIVGTVIGSFFLLSGHIIWAFMPGLVFALLADMVAKSGNYQNKYSNQLSFLLFSFISTGPIFLMWMARSSYVASLVARGKSSDYINRVLLPTDVGTICWFTTTVILGGIIGSIVGMWLKGQLVKKFDNQ